MKNLLFSRKFTGAVTVAIITALLPASTAWARYQVSAKSVIFSNSTKVVRYYGKNVHARVKPASTVKIMTALLTLEHLPLDKVVTVSQRATTMQPSKIHVKASEQYRVKDLLYALLLNSANDAAVVLAEAVGGSEENFVRMMNARARKLGARHTRFVNANGLPSKQQQYSTAYDMYLIFREAIQKPFFRQAIKRRHAVIHSLAGRKILLKTHNNILFKRWKRNVYGKTGWTRQAQQCFVGYIMKGNDICIISLFGATHRWSDIKHIISQYGKIGL